jgi:signal transduction histidine kinase
MTPRRGRVSSLGLLVAVASTLGALSAWLRRRRLASLECELHAAQAEVTRLRTELAWVNHRATHELRNPLTPIVARAEMLRRSLERPEELRQIDAILRAAGRMGRMIEDLAARAASAE